MRLAPSASLAAYWPPTRRSRKQASSALSPLISSTDDLTMAKNQDWQLVIANVFSAEWIDATRNDFGHYSLVYTYRVGDEIYRGESSDYRPAADEYLKRDDSIQVRYDPSNPKRSFYPEARSATNKRLFFFGIGAGI